MRVIRIIVLIYILPALSLACSCANSGTACTALAATPVVLLGRVIRDSGEGYGTGPGRMVVEEVLHGLPSDIREVEVDTMAGTSCYSRLALGERYVLYAGRDPKDPARIQAFPCSYSFKLNGNEFLWQALKDSEAKHPASLAGIVRKRTDKYGIGETPLIGMKVVATQGEKSIETVSDKDGQFRFTGVSPGPWSLKVDSPGYVNVDAFPGKLEPVPERGCATQSLSVSPNGAISGIIQSHDGKALSGIEVQAFTLEKDGTPDSSPFATATTDSKGHYAISGLPAQKYVVGVNAKKYEDESPYPPVFFPATVNAAEATRIDLPEIGTRDHVDLRVPAPRDPVELTILFVDEEGMPWSEAVANVRNLAGEDRAFAKGGKDGLAKVKLWQGESYVFQGHAFKMQITAPIQVGVPFQMQGNEWEGVAGPIQFDQAQAQVRVVLHLLPPRAPAPKAR